jgi:hypothetical protein
MLPAVQKTREAANRDAAERTLRQVAAGLESTYKKDGKFPAGLEEILARTLNFTYPAGGKDGYRIMAAEISPKRIRLISEPAAGVTGSMTGVLEVNALALGLTASQLNFVPTPGADEGREKMLAAVYDATARSFARWLGMALPAVQKDAMGRIRAEVESPFTARQVYQSLAASDGSLNFRGMRDGLARMGDGSSRASFTEFWLNFTRALDLGANGDDWASLPGITSLPAVQSSSRLLNFTNIARFAGRTLADATVAGRAAAMLDQAAAAEASGNLTQKKAAIDALSRELLSSQPSYFSWGAKIPVLNVLDTEAVLLLAGSM